MHYPQYNSKRREGLQAKAFQFTKAVNQYKKSKTNYNNVSGVNVKK